MIDRALRRIFITLILILSATAKAGGLSTFVGISPSDLRTRKPALSLGIGGERWLFSIDAVFNSQFSKNDFIDTSIPHSNYTDLGRQRVGTTFGFDVIRNFEIDERFPNIFFEGGLYFETTRHIVKS